MTAPPDATRALPPGSQGDRVALGGLLLRALPPPRQPDLAAQLARLVAADRAALDEVARNGENGAPTP